MQQVALAPQARFNERLLGYLRRDLASEARRLAGTERPRLVYVAPFDVLSRNGGAARVLGLAGALSSRFAVDIVSLVGPRRAAEQIPVEPGVWLHAVPQSAAFVEAVRADERALGGAAISLGLARHLEHLPVLVDWYRRLAAGAQVCVMNQPYLFPLWQQHSPGLPLIYDVPEVNSFFTKRMAGGQADSDRVRSEQAALESATCAASACIGMASALDMDALAREQGEGIRGKLALVPNGVWVDRALFAPPGRAREVQQACGWPGPLAVFLGSPAYAPNVGAVEHIARTLAPAHCGCTFAVIGMSASDAGGAPAPDNVVFLGRVSEGVKNALLAMADLALAPIPGYDSGSSLKVAEYIAHGKPVLATVAGRRGYEMLGDLLPEVALDAMADRLGALLAQLAGDRSALDADAARARDLLRQHYDWSSIARGYDTISGC